MPISAPMLPPLLRRRLDAADLDAVFALHRAVVADLPEDRVARESREFFAEHLAAKGRILGLLDGSRLVAYGVLGLPGKGDANFGVDHGLPPEALLRVAHLDGAAVAADQRGRGLQKMLADWRLDEARAAGRSIALSTVSPANLPSLASLLAAGLRVRGLARRYGGWRCLMRADLDRPSPLPSAEGHWLALDEAHLDQLALQLAKGWIGWELRATPSPALYLSPLRA